MRSRTWLRIEYLCKGVFLGLCYALTVRAQTFQEVLQVIGSTLAILLLSLAISRMRSSSGKGRRPDRWLALIVLVLLDSPVTVCVSIVAGLQLMLLVVGVSGGWPISWLLLPPIGGALIGLSHYALTRIVRPWPRRLATVLFLAVVGALLYGSARWELVAYPSGPVAALALSFSLLFFYLLTFAGRAEESELEIGLLCFGVALALLQCGLPPAARGLITLGPVALFVVYCERMRKSLIVFKHVLRGISYEQEAELREALISYQLALRIDPKSELATAGNWRVHRRVNLTDLADDDEVLELIDPVLCLERARLLLNRQQPSDDELAEADKLLDIVAYRRRDLAQTIGFERLRGLLAGGHADRAMTLCRTLVQIAPAVVQGVPDHEAEALFRVWSACLKQPLLIGAGGLDLLADAAGLFGFLAALERRLQQAPDDPDARAFKPFVYERISLPAYETYCTLYPDDDLQWLDYGYLYQLAARLADDPQQAERAVELYRIVEDGLPERRLEIWRALARLCAKTDPASADQWYQRIKDLALQIGPQNLSEAQKTAYFETVRMLAERARAAGNVSAAIENFLLFSESPKSGLDTLRTLQQLYESQGDVLMAIRPVEAALVYSLDSSERRRWSDEKARLYAALDVSQVQSRVGQVERFFDFRYCFRRAKSLFEKNAPAEQVTHYLDLAALGGQRELLNVNYMLGRTHYRAECWQDAALCLNAVKEGRPQRFADSEQEEVYFSACRLLGDLYLFKLNNPAKAIECYSIYKDYVKSGAETLFRLASAYEANGQHAHARKWYDMVLVYPQHPRAEESRQALARLGT